MIKGKLKDILNNANNLVNEHMLSNNSKTEINNLIKQLEDFKIITPVIGGFSAGKTSLLNAFIGENLLKVDIVPTTEIATELKYTEGEKKLYLYKDENVYTEFSIDKLGTIPTQEYLYQVVYINNDKLKNHSEIVLVDMPGLESNLEIHNKAILNYIRYGTYYILIIDIEDGTIKQSTLNFISEILSYNLELSIILNKIDKKSQKDVLAIQQHIKSQAKEKFGREIFVGLTSVLNNNIEDFVNIINKINIDSVTKSYFTPIIKYSFENSKKELETKYNSLSLNTEELDEKIEECEEAKEKVKEQIEKEKRNTLYKFSESATENIISDVKSAIKSQSLMLAKCLLNSGQETFIRNVNEIIRPIIIKSTQREITDYIDSLSINLSEGDNDSSAGINISSIIEQFSTGKFNAIYKGISGVLGISTAVLAPWLEAILIFLPEILSFISNLFSDGESSKIEKIIQKIEYDIIPQIASELRPRIEESLEKMKNEYLEQIEMEKINRINVIEETLKKSIEERDKIVSNYEDSKKELREKIELWENLIAELEKV